MRPSFTKQAKRPLLVCLMQDVRHPEDCIALMRSAMYEGADGFALHLEYLDRSHHNPDDLRRIFNYAADKPIYTMNYRRNDETDEDRVATQLMAIEAGASMVDIMGDIYDPSPRELSRKPEIIDKQKKLIDKVHGMGGEVLLSSHTWDYTSSPETVEHAKALEARGADMVKIAMCVHTEEEMMDVYKTTVDLKRELKVPYMLVCIGQYGKVHRAMAPILGSAVVLCVQQYTAYSHKEQVLLRATKAVYDNLDMTIARDDRTGTPESKNSVNSIDTGRNQ